VGGRSYDQFCPAARALDVVGERWTFLIARDLLYGPRRYTDLARGLPGIGPGVLSGRLKSLEAAGVIARRELPPPAASTVYELTPLGEGLRPVLESLFAWGLNFMDEPAPQDELRLGWLLGALRASFSPEAARDVSEAYEFRIDGAVMHAVVDDGQLEVAEGPASDPALVLEADLPTFLAVSSRRLDPQVAIAEGRLSVDGDPEAAARCTQILSPTAPTAAGVGAP
jgi:DNA-binding HxlR family transcriptional regulator